MPRVHDLGGSLGFGAVEATPNEPVFAAQWEARTWGLMMGTFVMGLSNGPEFRFSIERMNPAHYLSTRYYEHWATSVATRLIDTGRATVAELEQRAGGRFPVSEPLPKIEAAEVPGDPAPTLTPGDQVRVKHWTPVAHTRCPAYVMGRRGVVVRVDGECQVADVELFRTGPRYEAVYSVGFEAAELWGETAERHTVHVDLSASYLERETT